jgi:Ca2+/Na+ antiporter
MSLSLRAHFQIALVASIVAALGVANWFLEPTRTPHWLVPMGTMAVIWVVVLILERVAAASQTEAERHLLVASAVTAGLLLSASLALALAGKIGLPDETLRDRMQGVVMGLVLVAMGNFLPKFVPSLAAKRCSPARAQAAQRFAGWAFVLAGLGYAGAWIFLTPSYAKKVALIACAAATTLVIWRLAWLFIARDDKPPPT